MIKFLSMFLLMGWSAVFAEFSLKPYGKVSINGARNSAGTLSKATGNDTYYVESIDKSNRSMHVHGTKVGLKGESDLGSFNLIGAIEADFYGESTSAADELNAEPRLKKLYLHLNHKGSDFHILAGLYGDLISPLNPNIYDISLGKNQGNIGFIRPQVRIWKEISVVNLALSAAHPEARDTASESFDYTGRFGVDTKEILDSSDLHFAAGFAHLMGQDSYYSTLSKRYETDIHINSIDAMFSFNDMIFLSGEWYDGNATGYYDGLGTFNTSTLTAPSGDGWWVQGMVKFAGAALTYGQSIAEADEVAEVTTGTTKGSTDPVIKNKRNWVSLAYNFNTQIASALEYSTINSTFASNKDQEIANERWNLNVSYKF